MPLPAAASLNHATDPTTTLGAAPAPPPTTLAAAADLLSEDSHVFAAVGDYFDALVEANDPPDPTSGLFSEIATPNLAELLRADTQEHLSARQGIRRPADRQTLMRAPQTVLRRDSIAVVDACIRDNLVVYNLDTGAAEDDSLRYLWVQLTVTDQYGPLLVSQYRKVQEFDSEEPCIGAYR